MTTKIDTERVRVVLDRLSMGVAELRATEDRLRAELAAALVRLGEPIGVGETAADRIAEVSTGDGDDPGVYQGDDGVWRAWGHTEAGGRTVEVAATGWTVIQLEPRHPHAVRLSVAADYVDRAGLAAVPGVVRSRLQTVEAIVKMSKDSPPHGEERVDRGIVSHGLSHGQAVANASTLGQYLAGVLPAPGGWTAHANEDIDDRVPTAVQSAAYQAVIWLWSQWDHS